MFALSACTFGSVFVIVSLMKKRVVEEHRWLEEDEMLDVTAIAQPSPRSYSSQHIRNSGIPPSWRHRISDGCGRYHIAACDSAVLHCSLL